MISLRWLLLFFLSSLAAAQFTTVTGTVTDVSGLPYANGTISATLVLTGAGSPTLNGFGYTPPTQPTGLDATGSFVMALGDNNVLLPAGTKWNFQVCSAIGTVQPAGGKGPVCFSLAAPITITGASQSITANLAAAVAALSNQTPVIPIFSTPVLGTSMATGGVNTVLVGPVSMVTPVANGTYRFTIQLTQTTPGNGGVCAAGTIGAIIGYKDADTGVTYALSAIQQITLFQQTSASAFANATMTNVANGASNNYVAGMREFRAAAGAVIQYQVFQQTNSNCTTPPVFATRPALYSMGY